MGLMILPATVHLDGQVKRATLTLMSVSRRHANMVAHAQILSTVISVGKLLILYERHLAKISISFYN